MKRLIFLILFIAALLQLPFPGKAQDLIITLNGVVKDSLTKNTLPDATVSIKNFTTSTVFNTISDSNGFFAFNNIPVGQYQLKVEYIGYNTFTKEKLIIVDKTQSIVIGDIFLVLQAGTLEAVKVTSTSKSFIVQSAGKITLNIAQSPIAATSNAYDILLRSPGVMEQNGDIRFRAGTVSILIDGRPSNLSGDDLKNMLSAMSGSQIEKIEILPNPSAKYEAQGSSVINIKLAKNKNYGTSTTVLTGIGSGRFGKYNLGLMANYKNKKINIYSGYSYDRKKQYYNNSSDRIISPISNILQNEYGSDTWNNHSYRLGLDYDINSNSSLGIQFKEYSNFQDRSADNRSKITNISTTMDTSSFVYTTGTSRIVSPSVNLYYKTTMDSLGSELTINADYFNYTKQWNDNFITNYFDQKGKEYLSPYLLRDQSPANNTISSFSADYSHPSKLGNFEAGLRTAFTTTNSNIVWQGLANNDWVKDTGKTNHFIYKENINAAYITFEKAFKEVWQINAGLRAEQTNTQGILVNTGQITTKHYLNWFPNITIQYLKNINNVFNLSYRKSIDRFGFDIVNPFIKYQSQYAYYQGNPNISPAINHTVDFTYAYKQQAMIFGLKYTHSINALGPVFLKGSNNATISSYTNFKSDDLFYIYGYWRKELIKRWNTNLIGGIGFLRYNTSTAHIIQQNDNATWTYLLQWNNSFNLRSGWNWELNASYQGPLASGIYKLGDIFSSGLGISKQLWKNKASVKLSVTDLLNTQKKDIHINYNGILMQENLKAESRFVNLMFTYKLGNKNVKAKKERASKIDDLQDRMAN